jgi:2-polyprenyl-3-methyl-5-hydroxy-6-metoxy-1,4-benzoquinol methylase
MFGATVDYWLLRPFTHDHNLATEEEIERDHAAMQLDIQRAIRRIQKLAERLKGRLPIEGMTYLDVGCGSGDMTLGFARLGARHVTGVDFVARAISVAKTNAERLGLADRVEFVECDIHEWVPPRRFDVVLSHEAMEHIHDPQSFLRRLAYFVAQNGVAVLAFGPLFYSPVGDHMWGFFRLPIPWRGALFSEKAILRLRKERFRPTDHAHSYEQIVGGLNQLRYSDFLRFAAEAGWKFQFLDVNPQLRKFPVLYRLSEVLCRVPHLRDYFATSVYAILARANKGQ